MNTPGVEGLSTGLPGDDGEMAIRLNAHDWARTHIGAAEDWPPQLKTLVQVILGSSEPMFVVWGSARTLLYNDAYAAVLANKHPAVGQDFLEVWHEIRADLEPLVAKAYAGEPTRRDDIELVMERKGYPERTHWTYSYTPVRLDSGAVGGFLCACHEITRLVTSERRIALLLDLEASLRMAATPRRTLDVACEALCRALGGVLATFNELDVANGTIDVTGEWHAGDTPSLIGRHPIDAWGAARVADLLTGRLEHVEDVMTDPRTAGAAAASYASVGCRASLSVPFVREGQVVAMFSVGTAEPRRWLPDDLSLANSIMQRSWEAVERARAQVAASQAGAERADTASALHALLSHAPLGFAFFDRQHRYTRINAFLAEINGVPVDAHLGRTIEELLPVNAAVVAPVLDQVIATGRAVSGLEVNGETPAHPGEPRSWLTGFFPVFGTDGNVTQVGATVIDITSRKQAEAELRESEERLRLATDHAEVGFWDVDEVRQRLHWPPIVKAMFGISPNVPVTMQDFYAGLHPEDRDATSAAYAAAADPARRALYDVEYRTVGQEDGVVRWVAAKGRGLFDETGRCLRVIGTAIDITSRKAAEAALAASEARLRELNETLERRVAEQARERDRLWKLSRDPLLVADAQGRWLSVSPAWFELLGYSEQELLGRTSEWMEHPDDIAKTRREVEHLAEGGTTLRFENRFRTRSGAYRWFSWTAVPDEGLLYAVARDITDDKKRAAELAAAQDALRQAQKMEAVGQLTGGLAHDFNNLLQGISGNLELILRKAGDSQLVEQRAQAARKTVERGARLTAQLLAFSRTQQTELKPVALSRLVSNFREIIERTIGPHIQVNLNLAPEDPLVVGDEVQIETALLNLALNARDAMPNGGEIAIRTRVLRIERDPALQDGDYVELAISDTGAGMSGEVAARAFDPFFTTKGVGKGTGLGLSQVYAAVRQAGGTARIESRLGDGTTVRLLLRRTSVLPSSTTDGAQAPNVQSTAARILVVDDDPDVRQSLAQSLDALGFAVTEAEDGRSGLAELERLKPDLLILDFAMPGVNGADVARCAQELHPDLPIVFATGFADSAAIERVAGTHMSVLRKPFTLDELQRTVDAALRQRRLGARAARP